MRGGGKDSHECLHSTLPGELFPLLHPYQVSYSPDYIPLLYISSSGGPFFCEGGGKDSHGCLHTVLLFLLPNIFRNRGEQYRLAPILVPFSQNIRLKENFKLSSVLYKQL